MAKKTDLVAFYKNKFRVLQHAATFSVSKDGIKASAATAAVFATRR
jgi:serine protease inhibitor